jgi:hypothetical protein
MALKSEGTKGSWVTVPHPALCNDFLASVHSTAYKLASPQTAENPFRFLMFCLSSNLRNAHCMRGTEPAARNAFLRGHKVGLLVVNALAGGVKSLPRIFIQPSKRALRD